VKANRAAKSLADTPSAFDPPQQLSVVGEGEVLLKAEGGRHVVNADIERFAQRQHGGERFGAGETGQLVDRKLPEVGAPQRRGERALARFGVGAIPPLEFLYRRPYRAQQLG
jgi:hypothetical protein